MRTLIYTNTGLTSWQIGINTEVIDLLHSDLDREVLIVNCNGVLQNCYFNKAKNPIGCAICQSRQHQLLNLAGVPKERQVNLELLVKDEINEQFDSLEDLVSYTYMDFPIGRGVASSIISYFRDYEINSTKYGDLINIELQKSINVLLNFKKFIKEFQPEEIYLFNGRFAEVWPVVLLAEKYKIKYFCIETGSFNKYQLFENTLPHSIDGRHAILTDLWKNADEKEKIKVGISWFENRRNKTNVQELQFTLGQTNKLLPKGFDPNKINIAIFNSSEDEMKVIQEWENDMYKSQNEAIVKICEMFLDSPLYHFYLRVHPNLGVLDNLQMREISQFSFPNLTIIGPNEQIDTYALLDSADKIITFGSSIGIEATYWGKISIMLGKSFYSYLDVVYNVFCFEDIDNLIRNNNLTAKPRANTLSYGYFILSFGHPLQNFSFNSLKSSYYKGKKVRILTLPVLKYIFKYIKYYKNWRKLLRIFRPSNPLTFK
ncbi:MAG: hypothetical protein ACI86M_002538 [Saprospiraceae bacterium]|jgi:hypothetical protein